jgi:hypothetical protein
MTDNAMTNGKTNPNIESGYLDIPGNFLNPELDLHSIK